MKTIGLTGGIGSGKSYIGHLFELLGADLYNADKEAKEVMTKDPELTAQIKSVFGEHAYHDNGELNREYLAQIIFSDEEKRLKLNSLVHPALLKHFFRFAEESTKELVIIEAAILIESGFYKHVDKIIVVTADKDLRIRRIMERDKATEEQIIGRITAQMSDSEREKYADFILLNNEKELTLPQIISILEKI
ncbi:MAG: dephospho-CoA kinase [Rikenellaceae bacterium]